jgi:FixJ family two-component response regulator
MEVRDPIVLVIDDDESVRSSLARLFRSAGLSLQSLNSSEELLDLVQLDSVGCLILDVHLPGMNGLELQEICHRRCPSLPIIMISAFIDDDAERRALAAGAVAFFHKPFDAALLLATTQNALNKAR